MECEQCGRGFRPSGHGRPQRYCSKRCRNRADYLRRKSGVPSPARKKAKPAPGKDPQPAGGPAPLTGREFDRMMDGKLEDVLRHNRDRLQAALDDPGTPANALPAISRQLIAVCRELDSMSGGDPLLDGLMDDSEVDADAGASVV